MNLLEVKGLKKSFHDKKRVFYAVKGIDFTLAVGECLGIVGESGCGKSTTANMIARLLKENEGEIIFLGEKINTEKGLKCVGQNLQMVFQNPKDSFNPRYTVLQAVMQGAKSYSLYSKEELKKKALEMIEYVGLKTSYADALVNSLSGGECQRVAIARALICNPKLIIFDEATSALDVSIQAQIIQLMRRLKEEKKVSFLFITHDLALTSSVCDRIAVMYAGRVVETGRTSDILNQPLHPYTKQLLSAVLPLDMEEYELPMVEHYQEKSVSGCEYYEFCSRAKEICKKKIPDIQKYNDREIRCHLDVLISRNHNKLE